jgi:hypothetical protein
MRLTRNRTNFVGAWTLNADRIRDKRTLLICGTGRGGTSFAASAFLRLGVPFARPDHPREASKRTHEHKRLRRAFKDEDEQALRKIVEDFDRQFDVWAWKLPQMHENFELVSRVIANPHYVFVFKEPVSIAFRRSDVKGAEFLDGLDVSTRTYSKLARFARECEAPIFFIGYEAAMANVEAFLDEAARFADVTFYDTEAIAREIEGDAERYYPGDKDAAGDENSDNDDDE